MKIIYKHTEKFFEKLISIALRIFSNSITFFVALTVVIFWLLQEEFRNQPVHDMIKDVFFSITFLSFFIIQKSFNRFSA
jgi:low affinity Fe/Cu permease